jgi:hypothetical protein
MSGPYLPSSTIVPNSKEYYVISQYFTRLYEQIAINVNSRDFIQYPIAVTTTATPIPNLARFGAFLICVSGVDSSAPTLVAALVKSTDNIAGTVSSIVSQAGSGAWALKTVTITPNANTFLIQHDRANFTGSFNIRIIGTQ